MTSSHAPAPPPTRISPEWLALRREEPLDPARPIVDSHHHLWVRDQSYTERELGQDAGGGHNIVATVFCEGHAMYREGGDPALASLGETEYAAACAERAKPDINIAAIVAMVDLSQADRVPELLELHAHAARGRLRGVRNVSAWDSDPGVTRSPRVPHGGMLEAPAFRAGFAHFARSGLVFDSWLYHPQIGRLRDLADAFPETVMVLNHTGMPLGIGSYAGRRDEVMRDWKARMAELAERPNVRLKVGGLAMPIMGFGFHERELPPSSTELAHAWRPYVETAIELFGTRRCMFESNFPVDKIGADYTILWNALKRITTGCSSDERNALFQGTASETYRIAIGARNADGV